MVTVFWDSVGVILVDFMSKGATINSDVDIDTSKKLKARIQRVRPALEMFKVLLQHDNARLYCKESLRGRHFSSDEEVKTAVWKYHRPKSYHTNFHSANTIGSRAQLTI